MTTPTTTMTTTTTTTTTTTPAGTTTNKPWAEQKLYGTEGDEYLYTNLEEAIAQELDTRHQTGSAFPIVIEEFSVHEPGETGDATVWNGAQIAEDVAERFADECVFAELEEQYSKAASEPDVVAAFQTARDLLCSKQAFLVADNVVRKYIRAITTDDLEDADAAARLSETGIWCEPDGKVSFAHHNATTPTSPQ